MLTLPESSDASLHSCLDLSSVSFEVLCGVDHSRFSHSLPKDFFGISNLAACTSQTR